MTYVGDASEVSGLIRRANEVEQVTLVGTVARFVATGDVTNERYGLYRWDMPAEAGGASPHFHKTFSEAFYVIDGTVELYDGEGWIEGHPGDFFFVPEGGIHGFRNESGAGASMLILFAPAPPREQYFRELAEIIHSGREMTPAEWTEFYARHDQYMV